MGLFIDLRFGAPPQQPPSVEALSRSETVHLFSTPDDGPPQVEDLRAFQQVLPVALKAARAAPVVAAPTADVMGGIALAVIRARRMYVASRGASFETYVYAAVRNAMMDLLAYETGHQDKGPKYVLVPASAVHWDDEDSVDPDWDPGEDESGLLRAELADVRAFVASLPPRQRTAVALVYWEGMSPADAGRAMGISRNAIRELLEKAMEKGREALKAYRY